MTDDPLGAAIREKTEQLDRDGLSTRHDVAAVVSCREFYLLLVIAGSAHTALCAPHIFTAQYLEHVRQASRGLETLRKLWGLGT